MPASQISFASFAASLLASVQDEPIDCTPSAGLVLAPEKDSGLVAQAAASGGECVQPHDDFAEFSRLTALAESTAVIPFADPCSAGGYVLMALANCYAPMYPGRQPQSELIDLLRAHAQRAIGAGC